MSSIDGAVWDSGDGADLLRTLLFLSRESLSDEQKTYLESVFASCVDPEKLLRETNRRLIGTMALVHMVKLANAAPSESVARCQKAIQQRVAKSMLICSEMKEFHRLCISATLARHVFIKGPSLASQYYRDPFYRECRDIDVLVERRDVEKVVQTALDHSYRLAGSDFESVSDLGLEAAEAMIHMSDVITLCSPRGVYIEVHKSVDRNAGIFPCQSLLDSSEPHFFFGSEIRVLPAELAFCYVAYHSMQHTWSRLNWFADIHAMLSSPQFNRRRCLGLANGFGLTTLVEACMAIDDWCEKGAEDERRLDLAASEVYGLMRMNIGGDLATEKKLILSEHTIGLPRRFRASRRARAMTFMRHVRTGFSPDFALYCKYPLRRSFWWVYSIMRPIVGVASLLKGRASKDDRWSR